MAEPEANMEWKQKQFSISKLRVFVKRFEGKVMIFQAHFLLFLFVKKKLISDFAKVVCAIACQERDSLVTRQFTLIQWGQGPN